ncbi:site-specific DNA-methyltransferase [Neisseria viridiae]|uniref:site-specific DNA-methyltransferase n=1 Tax=Neisseria viridiae TaxID=2830648 RepID=UPI0035716224
MYTSDGITANSTQLEQLKKLFPACFDADGHFLIDKFQAEIALQTDIGREFYEMNWLGKSYARLLRNLPPETLISEDKTHNAKPENAGSQNLLICGDNLEVLKHLKNAYTNSVKMIYIDPPYNTGSDGFVYQDNRKFTSAELARLANIDEDEAARILDFTDKGSNSHSAWLTFMYPRLYVARELLKDDGVIFISIDDNEAAQLKLLCDEVFGEGNFVAVFPWRKRTAKSDVPFGISQDYEWVICYAFNNFMAGNLIERKYYKTDDFPNDRWRLSDLTTQKIEADRPNSAFNLIDPRTKKIYPYNPNRLWGITKDTFQEYYDKGKIVFPDDYDFLRITIPAYRVFESEDKIKSIKKFGTEKPMKSISTLFPKEIGMTEDGNKELIKLFGKKIFSFPKPTSIIKYIIDCVTKEDDLILDFFAGSGTTAHAVMQLNAEEQNGSRRYICVQLPEKTAEKSEAYKAGYPTIFDITKARIEKAAAKIRAEYPDYTGDSGFKIFQTADNFRQHPDKDFSPNQPDLPLNDELSEEQLQTLLTTWTLYDGAALTTPVEPVRLGSYTAYLCEKRLYLMNAGFTSADLLAFIRKLDDDADFNPNRVIVFGSNMASAMQHELDQAVRGYTNKKEIELNVVIRV